MAQRGQGVSQAARRGWSSVTSGRALPTWCVSQRWQAAGRAALPRSPSASVSLCRVWHWYCVFLPLACYPLASPRGARVAAGPLWAPRGDTVVPWGCVEYPAVGSISELRVAEAGPSQLRVTWRGLPGAGGYLLTWRGTDGECGHRGCCRASARALPIPAVSPRFGTIPLPPCQPHCLHHRGSACWHPLHHRCLGHCGWPRGQPCHRHGADR